MNVYICSDLEGAACVFSRREGYLNASEYGSMELIAVCEALLRGGVSGILINCFHILEYDKFPKQVSFFHSEPTHDFFTPCMEQGFDVAMVTGMHAMAGGKEQGCWRHTISPHPISNAYSSIAEVRLNGIPVGETALFAMFAGRYGVPVVYVSGEHWACEEAKELLPGVNTCAVKRGHSYFSAKSLHPAHAAQLSANAAVSALDNPGGVNPYRPSVPLELSVAFLHPHRAADAVGAISKAERVDETTVRAVYNDVRELADNIGCLRAEENALYRADTGFPGGTTGFLTRYGPEPYKPVAGFQAGEQIDFAAANWGK